MTLFTVMCCVVVVVVVDVVVAAAESCDKSCLETDFAWMTDHGNM